MKKCLACHAEIEDEAEKCPMCGREDFETNEDEEIQELPKGAKAVFKTIFVISNIFSLIVAIAVCGGFIGVSVMVLKETGAFEGKFGMETIFALVFMGFGIFALVSIIRGFLNNREKIKEIDDDGL